MSWHTSAVLIGVDRSSDMVGLLDDLGFPDAQYLHSVSFEEASSSTTFDDSLGLAVATVDGWTSIWGPFVFADQDALSRISREVPIFTLILEGASGTYGFEWYRDGSSVRRRMEQAGEVVRDEGEPLAEEREVFRDSDLDEQGILRLMARLAIPLDRLDSVDYDAYELPD